MSKLRAAMGEDPPKIIGILRERAMDGDMRAIELVMSWCLGPLRAAEPTLTLPLTGNPGEDATTIAQAAGRGEISPSTAQQLMGAVASQARVLDRRRGPQPPGRGPVQAALEAGQRPVPQYLGTGDAAGFALRALKQNTPPQ